MKPYKYLPKEWVQDIYAEERRQRKLWEESQVFAAFCVALNTAKSKRMQFSIPCPMTKCVEFENIEDYEYILSILPKHWRKFEVISVRR